MAPGYACPVCDVHQADAVHLANHLAVTASLGREAHLAWLEEHAPEWADCGPEELAELVADDALEVETPPEPSAGDEHAHDRGRPGFERELARQAHQPGRGGANASAETARVLEQARELTRQRHDGGHPSRQEHEGEESRQGHDGEEARTESGDGDDRNPNENE